MCQKVLPFLTLRQSAIVLGRIGIQGGFLIAHHGLLCTQASPLPADGSQAHDSSEKTLTSDCPPLVWGMRAD